MTDAAQPTKKVIAHCIYCPNPPDGQEHWLNRSLGTFKGNSYLTGRICDACNKTFGRTIDLEFARTGHTGMFRQLLGIKGRSSHEAKNVFDYKASHTEPPIQLFHLDGDELKPVLQDAVGQNADGTLKGTVARLLVIETTDGKQEELRFPKGWDAEQLRRAVEARGLINGRPVAAHVAPPETTEEFIASVKPIIREVFGPFAMDVRITRTDDPIAPVVPTLMRFNLGPEYRRALAKIAFHYLLWACPPVGGDEPEFGNLISYIRDGVGEVSNFVKRVDALVTRTGEDGEGNNGHVLATVPLDAGLLVQVHFFSLKVGPTFPSFVVRLGAIPASLPTGWRSLHAAAYREGIAGHDGVLIDLLAEGEVDIS